MKIPKLFKPSCFNPKLFILLFFTSFNLEAVKYDTECREVVGARQMKFVRPSGDVYDQYLRYFKGLTGAHGNIKKWDTLVGGHTSNNEKGIIGEAAAITYFESLGYEQIHCKFKTVGNQGIDAIFVKRYEVKIKSPSHMIINEAKFSQDNFNLKKMFPHYNIGLDLVQQSHSKWNYARFRAANISCVNYRSTKIVRTATYLNSEGTLQLYEIKDEDGGFYPSDPGASLAIRTAWNGLVQ